MGYPLFNFKRSKGEDEWKRVVSNFKKEKRD